MSGEFLSVRFVGQGAVIRALGSIKDAMTRKGVMRMIAEEALALIKTRTLDGLDAKDRPLIPSRRVKLHGGQTLSDSGGMLGSMGLFGVTASRATIGFGSMIEAKKAWWAQDGTKTKRGGVKSPKRPFFGISPRDAVSLQPVADDYIAKAVRAAETGAR